MGRKGEDMGTKIVGAVAAMAAGFLARKVITFTWTRVTGKKPPARPEDPQVAIAEALGWAVVMGVGMEIARLLATRAATRRYAASRDQVAELTD